MPTTVRLNGPFTLEEREQIVSAIHRRLHDRGYPVSKRALNSLLSWNWAQIQAFAREIRIDASELLMLIETEIHQVRAYPKRKLPTLHGETTGDRLRAARHLRQRNQQDFERIAGLGAENLSRYERDARNLRNAELRTIIGIAMTLECPLIDVYHHILQTIQ